MTPAAARTRLQAEVGAEPDFHRATRRVAVYTRVSTDEQAALEFNSLQAQEQICKTYVSMRSEDPASKVKWVHAETYSDPGYSGGTLERPGLRLLLADIETGRVDTLIVYKIDRLSRSIHQFYRIWEVLQGHGVDLVSATQDLNTSTSQGKLMLNMLLSFGQFEREQIGERTRDKIRAARRRGKWTGGLVPLGYDLQDGHLVVNEAEANQVRGIFSLYLETLSLTRTVEELSRLRLTMKTGAHQNGSERSGRPFDKPSLMRVLRSPIYAGWVRCNGALADGEHQAIVGEEIWQQVQRHLTRNGSAGYQGPRANHDVLLKGILFCGQCGSAMTPTYTSKPGRRFRYYRCLTTIKKGAHACPTGAVPAHEVEAQVVDRIRDIGRDPALVTETVEQVRRQRDELIVRLEAERRELSRDLRAKKASLKRTQAKANGDGAEPTHGDLDARIHEIADRLGAIPGEIKAARRIAIDEADVRSALEAFGPLWEELWLTERTRILELLVEGIGYDGREKRIAIRFRTDGIGSLSDVEPS